MVLLNKKHDFIHETEVREGVTPYGKFYWYERFGYKEKYKMATWKYFGFHYISTHVTFPIILYLQNFVFEESD